MTHNPFHQAAAAHTWIRGGRYADGAAWKEWLHFVILGQDFEVIANVNLLGAVPTSPDARLILLVRRGGWRGNVWTTSDLKVLDGGRRLRVGGSEIAWTPRGWRLDLVLPDDGVALHAEILPGAGMRSVPRLPFGAGHEVQWNVLPWARATGEVHVAGEVIPLTDAPAYQDHNHGCFSWGGDFVWEWGAFLPDDAQPAVFSRLLDRSRHRVRAAGLMTWRDGHGDHFYGDLETSHTFRGRWRGPHPLTVPPSLSALVETGAVGIPAQVVVRGHRGHDADTISVTVASAVRLAVPAEADPLATVVVWELTGPATRARVRDGVTRLIDGRAILELVRVRH